LSTFLFEGLVSRSLVQFGAPLMKFREAGPFHHSPDLDVASTLYRYAFRHVDMCILSHNLTVAKRHE
jgi:hypothetical protein